MPYKSKAQQRKFHADPELRAKYADEFDESTKKKKGGFKSLPEKSKKKRNGSSSKQNKASTKAKKGTSKKGSKRLSRKKKKK